MASLTVSTSNGTSILMKQSNFPSLYAVGGYWILTYVEKMWQYKCVHNKAFNILLEVSI